jgi:hypothetical protein
MPVYRQRGYAFGAPAFEHFHVDCDWSCMKHSEEFDEYAK